MRNPVLGLILAGLVPREALGATTVCQLFSFIDTCKERWQGERSAVVVVCYNSSREHKNSSRQGKRAGLGNEHMYE